MRNLKRARRGAVDDQTSGEGETVEVRLRRRITRLERQQARLEQALEERTAELARDLQEQRLLSLRVAELTDLVTELVGAAARGEAEFRRVLDKYDASI